MSRLRISAFFLVALCAIGCSSKETGSDQSSGTDETDEKDPVGTKRDGGKTDAKMGSQPPKRDASGDGRIPDITPGDESPWSRDDTGESGLSDGDIDKLREGGDDCAPGSLLYPYDGVVWPVGLVPPAFMFKEPVDSSYVKLSYQGKEDKIWYEIAKGKSDPGEMGVADDAWLEILRRTDGETTLKADVTFQKGSKISTCHYKWKVAQGAMTGSVFFNTYNHPDLGGQGAVLRLPLNKAESEVYLKYEGFPGIAGPCISCHSVSFNGQKLAASLHNYSPFTLTFEADSYEVGEPVQPKPLTQLPESTFAAFTPDGKKMLSMGNPDCTKGADAFPRAPNNFMLVPGPAVAQLHDSETGAVIQAKGLDPDHYMWMPQFSPDGRRVVFNHAKPDGKGGTDRRELAIMDYDDTTNTFSNLRTIGQPQGPEPSIAYAPLPTANFIIPGNVVGGDCNPATPSAQAAIPLGTCTGPCYPGWPFFTPDGNAVIYVLGSEPDFASAFPGRDGASKSELWYVDIESGQQVKLANAGDGPKPEDAQANYYPTLLPVSVGGYYWLFWTSMRDWGHRDLNPSASQIGSNWFGGAAVLTATRKRIWVSAIRPPVSSEGFSEGVADFSSTPFYLEGQANAGNIRAFAALNPCRDEGAECSSGIDCCTGFCEIPDGQSTGKCIPPNKCARLRERCTTDENCCVIPDGAPLVCLGGFCDVQIR